MKAQMILCDFAEEINGKLYIMGGGWGRVLAGAPAQISLAIILSMDREETQEPHKIVLGLVQDSGDPALDAASQPLRIEGTIESRPRQGEHQEATVFNAPVAIRVPPTMLRIGHYKWELRVDGDLLDVAEFDAMEVL